MRNVTDFIDFVNMKPFHYNNSINTKGMNDLKKFVEAFKYGFILYAKGIEIRRLVNRDIDFYRIRIKDQFFK